MSLCHHTLAAVLLYCAAQLGNATRELQDLRDRVALVDELQARVGVLEKESAELQRLYKEEQVLRKRYWNMMEDMKGKIRVYARCRPMSSSEVARCVCTGTLAFLVVSPCQAIVMRRQLGLHAWL